MTYVVAVDIGGTFTDLAAYDFADRRLVTSKSPTSYENFGTGILDCFSRACIPLSETEHVSHGTTLVINALLQRVGARTALVTTRGFRDVLEIARANRPDPFDLHFSRDAPLVPRHLRFEIDERTDATGRVIRPVQDSDLASLAERLKAMKIEAVAIFFLNSYANPEPEIRAAETLRRLLPEAFVTCSVDLTREWYEYERASTAAANAYVGPQVSTYLGRLERDLASQGFAGKLFLMGSNGGLLSAARAARQPVTLVESGPVGGVIGAAAYAEALGLSDVIAFDMGGTTAKCAQISEGGFKVESTYYIGGYVRGIPLRASVLDIVEVGSGGGSIAAVDSFGRLSVGPRSAGSSPGPACYGRGGREATITDANLALGRLDAASFLGGQMPLQTDAAEVALSSVADRLGLAGEEGRIRTAEGILDIATVIMADAIAQVSVKQGRDPRDFALVAYGGGGPLHASALAHELGIPVVIIPPAPGNFSALGMLLCDARLDLSTTLVCPLDDEARGKLEAAFEGLLRVAAEALAQDFGTQDVAIERFAEMRFSGQRHNLKVAIEDTCDAAMLQDKFRRDYQRRYGHADPGAGIEVQVIHVSAFVRSQKPDLATFWQARDGRSNSGTRRVFFGEAFGWCDADVFLRDYLKPGLHAIGPAVIEEFGSTTLVWPGDRFSIGRLGEIRIACQARGRR